MSVIQSLEITNFQRISAVKIEPTNNVIMLFGKNANGKTSVLDAIETTFCKFNARVTKRPVKDGAGRADIKIKLTDGTELHQKFIPSGPALTGTGLDGKKIGQKDVDQAISSLGVDASAFIHAGEKKQLETLLSIVDLPFVPAELDAERKAKESERLLVGQQGKAIGDVAVDASLPTEETAAKEIIAAIRAAEDAKRERADAEGALQQAAENVQHYKAEIERLQGDLASWETALQARAAIINGLPEPADTGALETRLASVEEANAAIRANNAAREQYRKKNNLRANWDALTEKIKEIDQRKADGLAAVEMPVEGLSFDEEGVLFQGIPFSRASSAEQVIVSLAMLIATDPDVRVAVIRNGNVLDTNSLQIIQDMCEDTKFMVFIEFVSDSEDHEFRLVDGELAA